MTRPFDRLRHRRRWRWPSLLLGGVLGGILVLIAVAQLNPWPSALVIRWLFTQDGAAAARRMTAYIPDVPLTEIRGVAYGDGPFRTLDAFRPASATEPLPTVIWIHGGAWISGSSSNVDPYARIIATHGWTTLAVNYTMGPEATYPTAVRDVAAALTYVLHHADELGVDPSRLVLAGDSAGAQLATQLAVMAADPAYVELLGIPSPLEPGQVKGMVLDCGIYDLHAMADQRNGLTGWGFSATLWAYTGTKDWAAKDPGVTMSTIDFVSADFPPTWISGGNGDPLTALQSIPMAERLGAAGVEVTTLFWPDDLTPKLRHEYQFDLELPQAQQALESTLDFLATVIPLSDP